MTYSASDLAKMLNGILQGDPDLVITGIAKIEDARSGELTFLANPKYERYLESTSASVVLVSEKQKVPERTVIRVADPYRAFAQLLTVFYPPETPPAVGIHSTSVVGKRAELGTNHRIGALVVIGDDCTIGDNVTIYPGVIIGNHVCIGDDSTLHAGISVRSGVQIGRRVTIQDNSVIGSEGFGFAPKEDGDYEKVPQVGMVVIEDDVEIGAGCTLDRATLGATRIEVGVKLDNLIQIAHNVVIKKNTVIAAQTGVSGSTEIGEGCLIGGQVGFVGHIKLGNKSMVGAQSGVSKTYPEGSKISGYPAKPHREELTIQAMQKKLPEISKRINRMEKEIESLQSKLNEK